MGTAVMQDSPNLGGLVGVCGPGCEPLYQVPCPPARVRPAWAEGQRLGTGAVQAGRLVHIQGSLSSVWVAGGREAQVTLMAVPVFPLVWKHINILAPGVTIRYVSAALLSNGDKGTKH